MPYPQAQFYQSSDGGRRMSSYRTGIEGEEQACAYLRTMGMQVLRTRYRAAGGEIDIIAKDFSVLRFVEVKYRPDSRLGAGIAAIDEDKRERLYRAAREYVKVTGSKTAWQIDLMEITRAGVRMIEDAVRGR